MRADAEGRARLSVSTISTLQSECRLVSGVPQRTKAGPNSDFWAHGRSEYRKVDISKVVWIEAEGDYVRLHTGSDAALVRSTLTGLLEKFEAWQFVRVHRSAAVRREMIRTLRRLPTGALIVVLDDGTEVPLGRRFGRSLRDIVGKLSQSDPL